MLMFIQLNGKRQIKGIFSEGNEVRQWASEIKTCSPAITQEVRT